jgi:hypothetical protein
MNNIDNLSIILKEAEENGLTKDNKKKLKKNLDILERRIKDSKE